MPTLNTLRDRYEPGKANKHRWAATRKASYDAGKRRLPGLFQTYAFGRDAILFALMLLAEIYGLANLALVRNYTLFILPIGLFMLDVIGALFLHFKSGLRCQIANRIVTAPTGDEREHHKLRYKPWHRAVRTLGAIVILAVAAFKIASFVTFAGGQAAGLALAVVLAYGVAAFVHLTATGCFLAEAWTRANLWFERRTALASDDFQSSPHRVVDRRALVFDSPIELVPAQIARHALVAMPAAPHEPRRYKLLTYGILTDSVVVTLIGEQESDDQKDILAVACVRAQLRILDSEPRHGAQAPPLEVVPPAEQPAGDAPERASRPFAPHAAALVMLACGAFLGGCAKTPRPVTRADLALVCPSLPAAEMSALGVSLADLAPRENGDATPVPDIHLRSHDRPEAIDCIPSHRASLIERLWGSEPTAAQLLDDLRSRLAVAGKTFASTAADTASDPEAAHAWLAAEVKAASDAGRALIAVCPPVDGEPPAVSIDLDGVRVPVAPSLAAARERIFAGWNEAAKSDAAAPRAGSILFIPRLAPVVVQTETPSEPAVQTLRVVCDPALADSLALPLFEGWLRGTGSGDVRREEDAARRVTMLRAARESGALVVEIAAAAPGADFAATLAAGEADAVICGLPFEGPRIVRHVLALDALVLAVPPGNGARSANLSALGTALADSLPWERFASIEAVPQSENEAGSPLAGERLPAGVVTVHLPPRDSALVTLLDQRLRRDGGAALRFGAHAVFHAGEREAAAAALADPSGVAIMSLGSVGAALRPLALAAAQGIRPLPASPRTIAAESYPLSRRLWLHARTDAAGAGPLAGFTAFALAARGQTLVAQAGFIGQDIVFHSEPPAPAQTSPRGEYARAIAGAVQASSVFRFQSGSAILDERAEQDIDRLAVALSTDSPLRGARLILAGFADGTGAETANLALSRERGARVAGALILRGVRPEVITGFGSALPVADNSTRAGRELNRRVEVWVKPDASPTVRALPSATVSR